MFNPLLLGNSFLGLVGLRQVDHPDFEPLPSTLLYTGENLLIDHPLINIENLDMCARNYSFFQFPAYLPGTTYGIDTPQTRVRVRYEDKVYRSKVADNIGATPSESPDEWEYLPLLGLYLEDLFRTAAVDAVNDTFNRKKIEAGVRTILSQIRMQSGVGNMNDLVIAEGALVGVEISIVGRANLVAIIDKIGLQLTQAQELTLYLYHSSQLEPIATFDVNHTKVQSFQWHVPASAIRIQDGGEYDRGGKFYLMYDQNDLEGQAIRKRGNFHLPPCSTCNFAEDIRNFNAYTQFLTMRTVKVTERNSDNPLHLWDLSKMRYVSDNNYGLNFEVTVKCDLSSFLIANRDAFAFAVRDTIIFKLLNMMANTTRQNEAQTKVATLARAEITDAKAGGLGFGAQLDKQLKGVDLELTGLDSACMPRAANSGLRSGTFGLASR